MTAVEPLLSPIRERLEATTGGPWVAEYSGEQGDCVIPHDAQSTREAVAVTRLYHRTADAEFIAHAREDVPRLLAAVEAVLELADQWQENFPYKADRIRAAVTVALGGDK